MSSPEESTPEKKRFRIQRQRLGRITFTDREKEYGFIQGEDFREDVFFHFSVWEVPSNPKRDEPTQPEVELWVEFEINDEYLDAENRLRAKVVRPTKRPMGRKLSGRDATFNIVTHHENARRKRPSWRKKD